MIQITVRLSRGFYTRSMTRLLIALLLLMTGSSWAQLSSQDRAKLEKLARYYNAVSMKQEARWLKQEIKAGRVRFDDLEAGTSANCDIETGFVTINRNTDFTKIRTFIELGATLAHERVHQNQDPDGWNNELWREHYGLGNSYERDAWGVGILTARQTAIAFRDRMNKATSARQKQIEADRLQQAIKAWRTMVDDWHGKSKAFGKMTLTDGDGFPLGWDDMVKEQKAWTTEAKKVAANSDLMAPTHAGKYRGTLQGPFRGVKLNLIVNKANEVRGRASGKWVYTKPDGKEGQCPFVFHVSGNVTVDGLFRCSLSGELHPKDFGVWEFRGRLDGRVKGKVAQGKWSGRNKHGSMSGTWEARR